jgi:hypothetical protein
MPGTDSARLARDGATHPDLPRAHPFLVPFGLGQTKRTHFREMLRIAWENRDNLGYAWRVLTRGVCDGCALGTSGLKDWTIDSSHLCLVRLNLLRLNTMGAMDERALADVAALELESSRELRELGRLAIRCAAVRASAASRACPSRKPGATSARAGAPSIRVARRCSSPAAASPTRPTTWRKR